MSLRRATDGPGGPGGPAARAARRARPPGQPYRAAERAYPPPLDPADPSGDSVVLAATRALLAVETRAQAAAVLHTAVHDLGGAVVPARLARDNAMPLDVSLGDGEPRLAAADPLSPAMLRLTHHLPVLVADALRAAARCDVAARHERRAAVDALTGVATRAEVGAWLGRARPGDVVCVLDLDGFKTLNDTRGHAAGDAALREFGALLRASVREGDRCGRSGGDEFVVLLGAVPPEVARTRLARLAEEWCRGDHGTGVSVGVAAVDERGAVAANAAADRAMYRAKRLGRGRVELAVADDYDRSA